MAICNRVLSRDTDIVVSVAKAGAVSTLGINVALIGTTYSTLDHGERLRLYTSLTAVQEDYNSTTEPYKAARDFFAQSPRPESLYVGRIFTADQAAFARGRTVTALIAAFNAIADGEFSVTINGDQEDITGLDFTLAADLPAVATIIQSALQAVGTGGYTAATFVYNSTAKRFELTSGTAGDTSTIAKTGLSAVVSGTGTDISSDAYLAFYDDPAISTDDLVIVDGYSPTGVADELKLLYDQAVGCLNKRWYGLVLTKEFRDDGDPTLPANYEATDAMAWAEANFVLHAVDTNNINTLSAISTSDVGYIASNAGYSRVFVNYHDQAGYYLSASVLARVLAVDYDGINTTLTAKFKDMPGIPVVAISDADLVVLNAKRVNTLTLMQGNERVYREGVTSNEEWYIDDRTNLDALADEIQSRVYDLYKRQLKVPFNAAGQSAHYSAIEGACQQFTRNTTITDRVDPNTGDIVPAYVINVPAPLTLSAGDRAARRWTGITVDVNLAGATHSSRISVTAFV